MKIKQVIQSRKFWASLIGLVVSVGAVLGIDIPQDKLNDLVTAVAVIVGSYTIGTGIESGLSAQKKAGPIIAAGPSDFERRMSQKTGTGGYFELSGPDA